MPDARLPRGAFARLGIVLGVALFFLFPHLVHGEDAAPACSETYATSVELAHQVIAQQGSGSLDDYSGHDAQALIAAINAEPPETDYRGERVLVLDLGGDLIVIGIVQGDCIAVVNKARRDVWRGVLRRALGDAL